MPIPAHYLTKPLLHLRRWILPLCSAAALSVHASVYNTSWSMRTCLAPTRCVVVPVMAGRSRGALAPGPPRSNPPLGRTDPTGAQFSRRSRDGFADGYYPQCARQRRCVLWMRNCPRRSGGVPAWHLRAQTPNLWIEDEPFAYQPALGKRVSLQLRYKESESEMGFNANIFGFGEKWNCSWCSYIVDGGQPTVYFAGGVGSKA